MVKSMIKKEKKKDRMEGRKTERKRTRNVNSVIDLSKSYMSQRYQRNTTNGNSLDEYTNSECSGQNANAGK